MSHEPPRYEVLLTEGAEQGLESLRDYIAESDGSAAADHVLDRLMQLVRDMQALLERRLLGG